MSAAAESPACHPGHGHRRGCDLGDVDSATRQHPRDHRVRVPHLAEVELVTTPHRAWVSTAAPGQLVRPRRRHRTPEPGSPRLVEVGYPSVSPTTDLVAEQSEVSRPSRSDRTLRDDPSLHAVAIGNGCLFDHVSPGGNAYLHRRVEQVATLSPMDERRVASNILPLMRTTSARSEGSSTDPPPPRVGRRWALTCAGGFAEAMT